MKIKAVCKLVTLGIFLASAATAIPAFASDQTGVTIVQIVINKAYGSFAFIKTSTPPVAHGCEQNLNWNYTMPLSTALDDKMFAMLLAAYSTGAKVTIGGNDSCNEFGTVESLTALGLVN